MTPERCPTCGGVVEVFTADEGTSSYRPRLVTDAMVERVAGVIGPHLDSRCGMCAGTGADLRSNLDCTRCRATGITLDRGGEPVAVARAALEAALGNAA